MRGSEVRTNVLHDRRNKALVTGIVDVVVVLGIAILFGGRVEPVLWGEEYAAASRTGKIRSMPAAEEWDRIGKAERAFHKRSSAQTGFSTG